MPTEHNNQILDKLREEWAQKSRTSHAAGALNWLLTTMLQKIGDGLTLAEIEEALLQVQAETQLILQRIHGFKKQSKA